MKKHFTLLVITLVFLYGCEKDEIIPKYDEIDIPE